MYTSNCVTAKPREKLLLTLERRPVSSYLQTSLLASTISVDYLSLISVFFVDTG